MTARILFLSLLLLLQRQDACASIPSGRVIECLNGIQTALGDFTFANSSDYWTTRCTNNLMIHSMWAAAKLYCTTSEIDAGSEVTSDYCNQYGNNTPLVPYSVVLPDLTVDYIDSLQVVNYEDINFTKIWNSSVLISKSLQEIGSNTTWNFDNSLIIDQRYGWGIYGFWGSLLFFGIATRFIGYIFDSRSGRTIADVEGTTPSTGSMGKGFGIFRVMTNVHHWVKANLIVPRAMGSHYQRLPIIGLLPTRMETVVVSSAWVLNIVLCCVSYTISRPNLYYTPAMQHWRYIADRSGIMAYANLPIIWMFSGRNNVFQWATGWSFASFNCFHQHVARIATIQAILHAICYTVIEASSDALADDWTQQYWYMGAVGLIAMSFLVLFSSPYMRGKFYDAFLLIHIALSILTIIALFYHTKVFDGKYNGYLWPLVTIWGFDRLARFIRLLYCNLHVTISGSIIPTSATVAYESNANYLRLDVIPGSKMLIPRPGQYYFVYQPLKWKGWENHPFTLASWVELNKLKSEDQEPPLANQPLQLSKSDKMMEIVSSPSINSSSKGETTANIGDKSSTGDCKMTFYIRPLSGWTKRVRDECMKSPNSEITTSVLIEGPYGEHTPLQNYENVVFIAGGTGISGALPFLHDYIARTSSQHHRAGKNLATRTNNITFVWASKQAAMICDIASRELRPVLSRPEIHASFYVTDSQQKSSVDGRTLLSSSDSSTFDITPGRPDVRATVMSVIDEVTAVGPAGGRIAVLVCGPAGMADQARAAVHRALKDGKRGIDYFEEAFGW